MDKINHHNNQLGVGYDLLSTQYKHLQQLKDRQATENRDGVLNAFRELGSASTTEVRDHLDNITKEYNKEIKRQAQKRYENGEIFVTEKRKQIKRYSIDTISLRTIQRKANELRGEGLLEKEGDIYRLTEKALSDVRYFPQLFGSVALMKIGVMFSNSLDQSLVDFVIRFGTFLVYTFIEAARPVGKSPISIVEKQRLFVSWMEKAVPLNDMTNLFFGIYGLGTRGEKHDKITVEKLRKIFQQRYPDIYKKLEEARVTKNPPSNYAFSHVVSESFSAELNQ
jgi:hypothetical protein